MTARTTTTARRHRTKAEKTALRWLLLLAAFEAPAMAFHSLLLAVLGILAFLVLAWFRLRGAHRRWRSGGKAAMRRRSKYQGHATRAEIRRNLSHERGVLIGTVRRTT